MSRGFLKGVWSVSEVSGGVCEVSADGCLLEALNVETVPMSKMHNIGTAHKLILIPA